MGGFDCVYDGTLAVGYANALYSQRGYELCHSPDLTEMRKKCLQEKIGYCKNKISEMEKLFNDFIENHNEIGGRQSAPHYDTMVILGTLKSRLDSRLNTAMEYAENNEFTRIVITGGFNGSFSESGYMEEKLLERGISPSLIVAESRARDTLGNAIFSADIFADHSNSVLVVTSCYHAPRAHCLFRKVLPQHIGLTTAMSKKPEEMRYLEQNRRSVINDEMRALNKAIRNIVGYSEPGGMTLQHFHRKLLREHDLYKE